MRINKQIKKIVVGNFFHTPDDDKQLRVLENAMVGIDDAGIISFIFSPEDPEYDLYFSYVNNEAHSNSKIEFHHVPKDQWFLPGLIDTHVHAPQFQQTGNFLNLPLEDWLLNHTMPNEARFQDLKFAERIYNDVVDRLLSIGTTTAVYFATIHVPATKVLADICLSKGQRAFIGKLNMDNKEQCPNYYVEETQDSIHGSREIIEYINNLPGNNSLVRPVVTPRFLPSCSNELLEGLGKLAAEYDCHVQSHLSESNWVVEYGMERFKKSDTEVFDDFGLLTSKCIMAHSIFLSETDLALFRERKAGIAHCPLSNFYFADAVFPCRKVTDSGVNVGLGTDIGGAPTSSMFNSMRHAITSSLVWRNGVDPKDTSRGDSGSKMLSFSDSLFLATQGGANAIGLGTVLGSFEVGKYFDAVQLKAGGDVYINSDNDVFDPSFKDNLPSICQKLIYGVTACNIVNVFVQGRIVYSNK